MHPLTAFRAHMLNQKQSASDNALCSALRRAAFFILMHYDSLRYATVQFRSVTILLVLIRRTVRVGFNS